MLLVVLNKMLRKIPSQVSNSDLEKYIEAKKCDDFIFENRDIDDKLDFEPCPRPREEARSKQKNRQDIGYPYNIHD